MHRSASSLISVNVCFLRWKYRLDFVFVSLLLCCFSLVKGGRAWYYPSFFISQRLRGLESLILATATATSHAPTTSSLYESRVNVRYPRRAFGSRRNGKNF